MNPRDVPRVHNPVFSDMDGYEWVEFGDAGTRVINYPFCPDGCRKFGGRGKPAPRIRLHRVRNHQFQHWSLKCWKCKKEWVHWA